MEEFSSPDQLLRTIEAAVSIVENASTVMQTQRQEAEFCLLELRKKRWPIELSKNILDQCHKQYAIFHVVSAIKESTLREWTLLTPASVEELWQYFLQFLICRPSLPGFVVAEIMQCVAMILKRGTFDAKCGQKSVIFERLSQLIESGELGLQSLACQMMLALCTEFCSSWRSSFLGMSWDFHIRAKRAFENDELKRILQLSLDVLSRLLVLPNVLSSRDGTVLTNRLLCVTEAVLNWNFASRFLPKRLTYSIEFSPSVVLKPPESWREVFLEERIVTFFFELHSKVRVNSELCHHSFQCLIQLASLSGVIFPNEDVRDRYVEAFLSMTVSMFSELYPHEVLNFASFVNKLLCFHPTMSILSKSDNNLQLQFLNLLNRYTKQFCLQAVKESMGTTGETYYEEAFSKLIDGWVVLIRAEKYSTQLPIPSASKITTASSVVVQLVCDVFDTYVYSHLAPPMGVRPPGMCLSNDIINEDEDNDVERYSDVLESFGIIARFTMPHSLQLLTSCIEEKLTFFCNLFVAVRSNATANVNWDIIHNLQEDLQWLLLITGRSLSAEDGDGGSLVPGDILKLSADEFATGKTDIEMTRSYLASSITSPAADDNIDKSKLDSVMRLIGRVLRWASIEHHLVTEGQIGFLSPQVGMVTMWFLRNVLCAYNFPCEGEFSSVLDSGVTGGLCFASANSALFINFAIQKAFGNIIKWSGEADVAKESVKLLVVLVGHRKRAEVVIKSPQLAQELGAIKLEQMSSFSRRGILKALVFFGAAADDSSFHQTMYSLVLAPLSSSFEALSKPPYHARTQTQLLDLIDCFSGIAEAAQVHTAQFLCGYLMPVMNVAPLLLRGYQSSQAVVDGVLNFYLEVTKKIAVYLEEKEVAEKLYENLLQLLKTYQECQTGKYSGSKIIEEETASDLSLMLQILTNLISRDLLMLINPDVSADTVPAAQVALIGITFILPLMNAELLKFPSVSLHYYRLLAYTTEIYPQKLAALPNHILSCLMESLHIGLNLSLGMEVLRLTVDVIGHLASFVAEQNFSETQSESANLRQALNAFVKPIFEVALESSCEVDLYSDATIAFYNLVNCCKETYSGFVMELLNSHTDVQVRNVLTFAFETLFPLESAIAKPGRKEKREFRERFDAFLNEVQGLLCLS